MGDFAFQVGSAWIEKEEGTFVGLMKDDDRAEFVPWNLVVRGQEEYDDQHRGLRPRDFKIRIKDPDRRDGQPRSVLVQLR